MTRTDEELRGYFNKLQRYEPARVCGAALSGGGTFGLVVDNHDDTVSKFMFRHEKIIAQRDAEIILRNEVAALTAFRDVDLGGVAIPRLVEPPQEMEDNPEFFAFYRMTRVSGSPVIRSRFGVEQDGAPGIEQKRLLYEGGALLSRFHAAVMSVEKSEFNPFGWGEIIKPLPQMETNLKEALLSANDYLQANRKEIVVHGDFHGGNILIDKDMKPVGLIDFGNTGISGNPMMDFMNVPSWALPHFAKGYESEGHAKVDYTMVHLAGIAGNLLWLSRVWDHPAERETGVACVRRHLEAVRPVIGFTPL